MSEQLEKIFEKERISELISLLQSMPQEEKRKLAPQVIKLAKHYCWFGEIKKDHFGYRGSNKQMEMSVIASFVCCTRSEYEKTPFPGWIFQPHIFKKVIDWYCPEWFSDFVNRAAEGRNLGSFTYEEIMELMERGLLQPGNALIALRLPDYIYEIIPGGVMKAAQTLFKPEKLLKWPATLQEHIWWLFDTESEINTVARWRYFDQKEKDENVNWKVVFKKYTDDGTLDRARVLKESLMASNKNFNKNLSGFFAELFSELEPREEELIGLQTELFSALSSQHSKPVNTSLQAIKKIVNNKQFNVEGFIDLAPVLLSSTTKSVVNSALMIMEKLAKKHSQYRAPICRSVMQVFIHPDEEVQIRAAKIIDAWRGELDEAYKEELSAFSETMLSSSRSLLADMMTLEKREDENHAEEVPSQQTTEWVPISTIDTFDDLIFLTSQLTDNNHSWVIDVLPASLLKFQKEIRGGNIAKLVPALQRAMKTAEKGIQSTQGFFDYMIGAFFIDYCIFLVRKYPDEAKSLEQLFNNTEFRDRNNTVRQWLSVPEGRYFLDHYNNYYNDIFHQPYKHLFKVILHVLRQEDDGPLLSTPTHEPGWIAGTNLVQRLYAWQVKGREPDIMDFQLAVSRCLLQETDDAIALAEKLLSGENLNLLLFLFGKHAEPHGPIYRPQLWLVASMTLKDKKKYDAMEQFSFYKKPLAFYTGQHDWQTINEEYIIEQYDFKIGKRVKETATRKVLQILFSQPETQEEEKKDRTGGFFTRLFSMRKPEPGQNTTSAKEENLLLYNFLFIRPSYNVLVDHGYMRRLFMMVPHNPEPLLVHVLALVLKESKVSSESEKRVLTEILQVLLETWNNPGNMAHLFLGTCMLCSDKTVANMAGEIWLNGITSGKIDNAMLGIVIGRHQRLEYAPIKRLTDLISQSLFRVSKQHNKALETVIENILAELPYTPVKNMKKLLEIYNELLAANKSEAPMAIAEKLNKWKKVK